MIEAEPPGPAMASVILMHGLGADAGDLQPLPPAFGLPAGLHVRYVFPSAPRMPVTINMGMLMPAWYDIRSIGPGGQDEPGIRRAGAWLDELIAREVARGVPVSRIVLAGFSQGGAMALFTGLRHPQALAGLVCMSGYLLLSETLDQEAAAANRTVPIFLAHGTADPMVGHRARPPQPRPAGGSRLRGRLARVSDGAPDLRRGADRHRPLADRPVGAGQGGMMPRANATTPVPTANEMR